MSPVAITILIVGGIALLMALASLNHMVENNKLEKARLKADLSDRLRRCADLVESLPGQLMSPALKLSLCRLQLHFSERLLQLDKNSVALKSSMAELRRQIALGDAIPVGNPPHPIMNEGKAKDVRFQLEALHNLYVRCAKEGIVNAKEAKHWLKEIQHMLVQVHIEFFTNMGQQNLQQGRPGQARLAFERGVQYLRKQQNPAPYQKALAKFEEQLARANAMVLETIKPGVAEESELDAGLQSLDNENEWKKKNIYD